MVARASATASSEAARSLSDRGADDDDHERQQPRRQEQHDGVAGERAAGRSEGHRPATGLAGRRPAGTELEVVVAGEVDDDAADLERAAGRPRGLRAAGRDRRRCARSFQCQVWPLRLLSTSASTSMRPSSSLALSFQSVDPEQLPRRMTSRSPASAGAATTRDSQAQRLRRPRRARGPLAPGAVRVVMASSSGRVPVSAGQAPSRTIVRWYYDPVAGAAARARIPATSRVSSDSRKTRRSLRPTGTWFSTTSTRQPAASADRAPVLESSIATQSRGVDAEQPGGVEVRLRVRLALAHRVAGDHHVEGALGAARRGPGRRTVRTTSSPARRACRRPAGRASSSRAPGRQGTCCSTCATTPSSRTSTISSGVRSTPPYVADVATRSR